MPKCPYCKENAQQVQGDALYPHRPDLKQKTFYWCKPCDAYVGCHPGTTDPLGTLANKNLRFQRGLAHCAFD